ncbi:MAG: hypothetical protein OEY86_07905 [Nitrospira sp.]|nr:hypothetical protein [Nitrospira sp.]
MPVNMDPSKKRRRINRDTGPAQEINQETGDSLPPAFGEETAADREKDLAEAELRNLWDATEVIDMDKA